MKGPTLISETVLTKAQSKEHDRHLSVTCPHAQHLEGWEAGTGWCETSEREETITVLVSPKRLFLGHHFT